MITSALKKTCLFLIVIFLSPGAFSQADNPKYDKALADSLGGDEYGMKKYVLVILKSGTRTEPNKAVSDSLFRGHMENINLLVKSGKLIIAGPLMKNEKNYRGIFIFNVSTLEEARRLVDMDPAIRANIFDVEMFQWYGSAAISEYLKAHEKIEKKKH